MANYQTLKKAIEALIDPGYDKTLKEVEGLKKLTIGPTGVVDVIVALKHIDQGCEQEFKLKLTKLVKVQYKFPGIKTEFVRNDFLPKGEKRLVYIGVASGKGGVGKSTVTANLAYALTKLGKKVGIIDADVYGATIADIFNISTAKPTSSEDNMMIPPLALDIEIISTAFFIDSGKPILWRGPMLGKLLNNYFYGVKWRENTDYILVDLPPGTGDTALDISKYAPQTKMIIITIPHLNASSVALKAGLGAQKIGHDLVGVVENMSYYYNNYSHQKEYLFGKGGGELVANNLKVDLLAQIPLNQPQSGHLYESDEKVGKVYLELAEKLISKIK
jgi:ATP-binding protein involved in chromosome partitioning